MHSFTFYFSYIGVYGALFVVGMFSTVFGVRELVSVRTRLFHNESFIKLFFKNLQGKKAE